MKCRRGIAFLCALALCTVSACAAAQVQKDGRFSDVPANAWYAHSVEACAEKGIMVGTSETTFSPDAPLGLDQMNVLLIRLYDLLHGGDGVIPPLPDDPMDYGPFMTRTAAGWRRWATWTRSMESGTGSGCGSRAR